MQKKGALGDTLVQRGACLASRFKFSQQLCLAVFKVYAELKAEAARSYLGVLWWLIEPVLYLGAYYILFVLVLRRGDLGFVPAFLCGVVIWKWFDSGVKNGGVALIANSQLMQQVYVPKYIFVLSAVASSTFRFFCVFCVLCLFLFFYGVDFYMTWFWVLLIFIVQFFLIYSLSLLLSAILPFVPDLRVVIDNGMVLFFFMSGIFFDIRSVHEPIKTYLMINPMAALIEAYRDSLLRGLEPDFFRLASIMAFSFSTLLLGLFLLHRWDKKYGKVRF